jgi:hypothetical protein
MSTNAKLMFANDKKQQQLAYGNSCARTGGHDLGKELSPIVAFSQRQKYEHYAKGQCSNIV